MQTPAENPLSAWFVFRTDLRNVVVVLLVLGLICGGLFPAVVIVAGQTLFPGRADGSLVHNSDGQVVGSKLIGQDFTGAEYFHPRPSGAGAVGYDAGSSKGRNYAPTDQELVDAVTAAAQAYREENGISADVVLPADAVTASASGLDPHISPANARLQATRVAEARGLSVRDVMDILDDHTSGRLFWILGEPRVNVLDLNLALDREFPMDGGE
jgi:K+-transporting ATPase ATPase C chain